MKLVIGGCAQGKLKYVLKQLQIQEDAVIDGAIPEQANAEKTLVINHFHNWFRDKMAQGECPEQMIEKFLEKQPNCIIISNEMGNGIAPIDGFEREYRERLGRCLTQLATQAKEVERVICGLGQRLK